MKKFVVLLSVLLVVGTVASGCKSSGSREFVPGSGWVPN